MTNVHDKFFKFFINLLKKSITFEKNEIRKLCENKEKNFKK